MVVRRPLLSNVSNNNNNNNNDSLHRNRLNSDSTSSSISNSRSRNNHLNSSSSNNGSNSRSSNNDKMRRVPCPQCPHGLLSSLPSSISSILSPLRYLRNPRKMAWIVFGICFLSSMNVIFRAHNDPIQNYDYYNDKNSNSINSSLLSLLSLQSSSSSSSPSDDELYDLLSLTKSKSKPSALRQQAIDQAKTQTIKLLKQHQHDEKELESLIKKFRAQLQKIENDELEKEELKQARIDSLHQQQDAEEEGGGSSDSNGNGNGGNTAYYLYYQDDNDSMNTVIGLPSVSAVSAGSSTSKTQQSKNDPIVIKRFVASLRNSGFTGNIIIGLEFDPELEDKHKDDNNNNNSTTTGSTTKKKEETNELIEYLTQQKVIIKQLQPVECTFEFAKKNQKCYHPYSHIKREWSYFPLARDWLTRCETCVGSVVLASVKDTLFQRNPFGQGMPIVSRLHLFEMHPSVTADDTSAGILLKACENIDLDVIDLNLEVYEDLTVDDPHRLHILSAGTAIGTRDDIIDYLGVIHSLMREWMRRSQCHFEHSMSDDGMAIVNYLRLQRRLPFRTRIIPHRTGIVNNVGYEGRNVYEAHQYLWQFKGLTEEEADKVPFEGSSSKVSDATRKNGHGWIDTEYLLTDVEGDFIDVFFQKSAIIYEYSAFGPPFTTWFDKLLNITSIKTNLDSIGTSAAASTTVAVTRSKSKTKTKTIPAKEGGKVDDNDAKEIDDNEKKETDGDKEIIEGEESAKKTTSTNTKIDISSVGQDGEEKEAKEKEGTKASSSRNTNTKNQNNNDDYYIEKVEGATNNSTTTTVNARKVKNTSDGIADVPTDTATKVEVEAQKEKEQPMYYKDQPDGEGTDADKTDQEELTEEKAEEEEEKIPQVVPVEETLEEKKEIKVDENDDEKEQDEDDKENEKKKKKEAKRKRNRKKRRNEKEE